MSTPGETGGRRHYTKLALAGALAVGAALRIWFLGTGGPYIDEAELLAIVDLPSVAAIFDFLRHHESHPPAYYLLTRGAGVVLGETERGATALALLFGLALIPTAYRVASRALASDSAGIAMAWLVAVSPTMVRYSIMARPYSMLGLLSLLAAWSLLLASRSWRPRALLPYIACGVAMVYSHNWSWLVLAGLTAVTGLRIALDDRATRIGWLLAANAAIAVLFLPWLSAFLEQVGSAGHQPPAGGLLAMVAPAAWVLTGFLPNEAALLAFAIVVLAIVQSRLGLRLDQRRRDIIGLGLGTIAVVSGLAVLLSPLSMLLVAQCFAMLTPLALLGVLAVVQTGSSIGGRAGFLLLGTVTVLAAHRSVDLHRFVRSNGKHVAAVLAAEARRDDLVLILPSYAAPEIRRHLGPVAVIHAFADSGFPSMVAFDNRIGRDNAPTSIRTASGAIRAARQRGARVWYVRWGIFPRHLHRADTVLREELEHEFGKPAMATTGTTRPVLYNELTVSLYGSRD